MTRPFRRFACTLVSDNHAGSGFDVVDFDPKVADSAFLAMLHDHMQEPTIVMSGLEETVDGQTIDTTTIGIANPKDAQHFEHAIRTIPSTDLMGDRRS